MKHTRKIICIALCILTVVTVFTACGIRKNLPAEEPTVSEESTTEEVKPEEPITIEEPSKETEKQTEKETTTKKEESTTKKTEPTTSKPVQSTTKPSTTKPATTKPQVPSTTKAPEKKPEKKPETTTKKEEPTTKKPETTKPATTQPTTEPKPYSCGKANHHCTTKEEHAFIVSLEEKGCPICSSHSCKSFYALDEWGNPCYDITRCPKYSVKKDPANTCEHCGREVGIGDNGTCVRFTVETKCPGCGKTVPAKTCHTH